MLGAKEASTVSDSPAHRQWWQPRRAFSLAEIVADGIVHGVGIAFALALGTVLIVFSAIGTAPGELPAIIVYVVTLVLVLGISLAFNLAPVSGFRRLMARLDQAAIFLFIAGSYTPFLALLAETPVAQPMTILVWGAALIGISLKLIVPQRFGRLAILLYLGIGWSGVLVFQSLAAALPAVSLWLLVAGGVSYSAGIVFHLWERLKFQNALWHVFVVAGSGCHLWAIFHTMVLTRL
ncbi:MAG: hemolysin III family protein [Alphaproteobacteria bacterium]|jgi:hemolysin III|nr:hemolysin III family protein [Alphaproteobacteria bacterium]